jgi:hypothetical protein
MAAAAQEAAEEAVFQAEDTLTAEAAEASKADRIILALQLLLYCSLIDL